MMKVAGWWLGVTLFGAVACSAASLGSVWLIVGAPRALGAALVIMAVPLVIVWVRLLVGEWRRPDAAAARPVSRRVRSGARPRLGDDELSDVSLWNLGQGGIEERSTSSA